MVAMDRAILAVAGPGVQSPFLHAKLLAEAPQIGVVFERKTMTTTTLTTTERSALATHEKTIEAGQATFVSVGVALQQIRDLKLYRATHTTFESYCEDRWKFSYRRAHQLIESSQSAKRVAAKSLPPVPTERVARALSHAPKERQQEAWSGAVKAGQTTAKEVEVRARKLAPPPSKPVLPTDDRGVVIPADLVSIWLRRHEVAAMAKQISEVKCALEKAQESKDPLYRSVSFSSVISNLQQAYADVVYAKPMYVCPMCQGTGCKACSDAGLMGKFAFDHKVPAEFKA